MISALDFLWEWSFFLDGNQILKHTAWKKKKKKKKKNQGPYMEWPDIFIKFWAFSL